MVGIERISFVNFNHPDLYTWNLEINHFKGFMGRWQAASRENVYFWGMPAGSQPKKNSKKKNGDELWPKTTKLHQVYVKHWVYLCLTSGSLRLMKDPCWFSLDKCWETGIMEDAPNCYIWVNHKNTSPRWYLDIFIENPAILELSSRRPHIIKL